MTYKEKLLDPQWQKKRLEILNRDEFECRGCHDKTETLHVHHTGYIPKTDPWDYPDVMLITLCKTCHEKEPSWFDESITSLIETLKMVGYTSSEITELDNLIHDAQFTSKGLNRLLESYFMTQIHAVNG